MKRFLMFVFAILAVVFMQTPYSGTAEAARVAVVPIQINEQLVERAADFNGYYWDIVIDKFPYPEYELMDDEKVSAVIPDEGLKSFDQTTLQDVCAKCDAEIVVAMRLDEVNERGLNQYREPMLEIFMKGEYAAYNRLTGRYRREKLYYKDKIEEVLTVKNDWQQQVFARELKRYLYRTLKETTIMKKK